MFLGVLATPLSISSHHQINHKYQKQPPKVFCKAGVNRETPVLDSLFDKIAGLRPKKESPTQAVSCEFCGNFKNTFFTEHLRVTASDVSIEFMKCS